MHNVHVDTGRACAFVRRCAINPNCRGALCVCVLQVLDIAAQHGMLVLIEVKELHKRDARTVCLRQKFSPASFMRDSHWQIVRGQRIICT